MRCLTGFVVGLCLVGLCLCNPAWAIEPAEAEFFEKQVRPVLVEHCYSCHSGKAEKLQAGLRVDSLRHMIQGGDSGPAVVPGKPDDSLLIRAVRYEEYEMPPRSKMPADQIAVLEKWVEQGAPWPDDGAANEDHGPKPFDINERRDSHWVWQPATERPAPSVALDPSKPPVIVNAFDAWITAKRNERNLATSESATPEEWARRVAFDLTGLPPESEQLDRFLSDARPDARRRYIDRLLASPTFGEHWARYWLDLVRYAESRGHEFDPDVRGARFYRDYVIRAFNQDLPYTQLMREHIAGDVLAQPRVDPHSGINESVLATGFWHLNEWLHSPVDTLRDEADRNDNLIDTFSKTFQGVTVACARCHDHKFDAIATDDYYSLATVLKCSEFREVRFASMLQNAPLARELDELQDAYAATLRDALVRVAQEPIGESDLARYQQPALRRLMAELAGTVPIDTVTSRVAEVAPENVVVDYQSPSTPLVADGESFNTRPRKLAEIVLDGNGDLQLMKDAAARRDPLWYGLVDAGDPPVNLQSRLDKFPRAARTLRTPTFELREGLVSVLVRGNGYAFACIDGHRQLFGPLHGETLVEFKAPPKEPDIEPRWVSLNLQRYRGSWTHLELTTMTDQPLEVLAVIQGPPPSASAKPVVPETPLSADDVARGLKVIAESLQGAQPWTRTTLDAAAWWVGDLNARVAEAPVVEGSALNALQQAKQNYQAARAEVAKRIIYASPVAPAMWEGWQQPGWVAIRGNPHSRGREAPRRMMQSLGGQTLAADAPGSGRLLLAETVCDPANPLTWRVMANRLWHQMFGRGIVASPDDFGVLGQPPTNPELLDQLAIHLREHDSIKQLVRELASSATYGLSCRPVPQSLEQDPENVTWHYRPPRRLTGEMLRDTMLFESGRLVRELEVPSVPLQLTEFMDGRGRPGVSGPLDGSGRRSIYLALRRNFLPPMFVAFDLPAPTVTRGQRSMSNVPSQALTLMNDPLVDHLSGVWAKQLISTNADAATHARKMMQAVWGRAPADDEAQEAETFVRQLAAEKGGEAALHDFAHVLFNTKEFLFVP